MSPTRKFQNIDKILSQALGYLDSGKKEAEIYKLFPDYKSELEEMFLTIKSLKNLSQDIFPNKENFDQLLHRLPNSVTNNLDPRYTYTREHKEGRLSYTNNNLTKILNSMTNK